MAIQWSGLGPELLLRLDRDSGQPLRSQLEEGLREAIRSDRLQGGERLPSSRELARELGTSRGLVQEVYSQLLSEGYLTSQVGSATRFAQGVVLVLRALARAGARCVAFEDPGYGSAENSETVRAAEAIGLHTVHVPVDHL